MSLHAFHVAVTEIEYDGKSSQLEITHRIFIDDLEVALTEWSSEKIDILNPSDPAKLNELIGKYLSEKTSYILNEKEVEVKYLGSEREEAVMYCYQFVSDIKKVKSLKVSNTVLMETFDDQTNIVHVANNETNMSLKLSKNENSGEVSFD